MASAPLSSEDSRYVLNSDPHKGWFGKDAQKVLPDFDKEYKCNPELPYHGFKSWDDFFTREFKEGKRPVASPDDDSVIVNACESSPYRIAKNIKRLDRFWIKAQSYSLEHMLAGDQIGMFHYGGSSHCLLFGPHVKLDFDLHGCKPGLNSKNIPVNARIATVSK